MLTVTGIEQKTITITHPKAGSSCLLEGRSRLLIRWESTGVERVTIFLELYREESDERPTMKWLVAENVAAISQSHSVVLVDIQRKQPILAGGLYRIRIVDAEGIAPDSVSGFFTIIRRAYELEEEPEEEP